GGPVTCYLPRDRRDLPLPDGPRPAHLPPALPHLVAVRWRSFRERPPNMSILSVKKGSAVAVLPRSRDLRAQRLVNAGSPCAAGAAASLVVGTPGSVRATMPAPDTAAQSRTPTAAKKPNGVG